MPKAPLKETRASESLFTVSRTFKKDGKLVSHEADTERMQVHRFETEPAEVGLTKGVTLNLGNFESAHIQVHCRVPSYLEEVDEAYKFVDAFCEERIKFEVEQIRGSKKKTNTDSSPL